MLDMLLCYGLAANMIRAGYLRLGRRPLSASLGHLAARSARVAAGSPRPSLSGAASAFGSAGEITLRRLARLEIHVTSMT